VRVTPTRPEKARAVLKVPRAWPSSVATRVVLGLLVAGLLVGTATHLENIVRAGLVPRPELPIACNLFWSALTLLDPLAIGVLLFKPRAGVLLVLAIMAVDLTVNVTTLGINWPVVAQLAYALVACLAWFMVSKTP
jgi:hypothetical protein